MCSKASWAVRNQLPDFPGNPLVNKVDRIIQGIIYDLGVNATVLYITTQVPFLKAPFFNAATKWVVTQVADILYKYLEQFVAFQIIDFQTDKQADEYLQAINKLLEAEAKGDAIESEKAIAEIRVTLKRLVRFDGV